MDNKWLNNRSYLNTYRKNLRNKGTSFEAILWNHLKNRQLGGYKFRRQHSFGHFILDFYCPEKRLAVELDGAYHFTIQGIIKDTHRDHWLSERGVTVLRFENKKVIETPNHVLDRILQELHRISS